MDGVIAIPIIGILCIDIDIDMRSELPGNNTFYISSAYVKWLESAGAKVVPIWADRNDEYYRDIMSKVNGVLFPDGELNFNDPEYGKAAYSARKIYDIAVEMNENGTYFPIWGTCLGHQLLFYAASGGKNVSRILTPELNLKYIQLNFETNYRDSKMFQNATEDILKINEIGVFITFDHKFYVPRKLIEKYGMSNDWIVTSTYNDSKNIEFITTSEHAKYPFYGVIQNPEKVSFMDMMSMGPTFSTKTLSQYFANIFVEETRKNNNSFIDDEIRHLIYNFPITFTFPNSKNRYLPRLQECYFFNGESDYPVKSGVIDAKQ